MRDIHFLRTPIRSDHQLLIQNIALHEIPLSGNPQLETAYPQSLEISFELTQGTTEIQIAPLWEGFLGFIPDDPTSTPNDPADVDLANYGNWSVTGDLVLRSYVRFVEASSLESAFNSVIPLITPVPTTVWYSKVVLTSEFLFTTLNELPRNAMFFNEALVNTDDPYYHEKLIINFLKGKAEAPCLVHAEDSTQDTAHLPMPAILLDSAGQRSTLTITLASVSDKVSDLAWFDPQSPYDDVSGEVLVDPTLQNEHDIQYNPAHPAHSVISVLALYQSAKLVAYAADHDFSLPLRGALTAARADGKTYRRIDLGRPAYPGKPVSANPSRPFPMYQLCWQPEGGGPVESQRIPLSGQLYVPLSGAYTFWAIPKSLDPSVTPIGDQFKLSMMAPAPAKYIDVPQATLTVDVLDEESVRLYSHVQDFDARYVWEMFDQVFSVRDRLVAKAEADWNAETFFWYILPTSAQNEAFAPIYAYIRESAGRHMLAPEFLLTIFIGEGGMDAITAMAVFDPDEVLDAFGFVGLDLILYRTGGTMPDGSLPPIPPEIPASEIEEIAEYSYNLVDEGYVDAATAAKVSWIGVETNETGRTLQVAEIAGWAAAIELVAAELHARLDEMIAYLAGASPPTPIEGELEKRFLSYIRFNSSPETARNHADNLSTRLVRWVNPRPPDNLNAHYNTIQRIAVTQWQEESMAYR